MIIEPDDLRRALTAYGIMFGTPDGEESPTVLARIRDRMLEPLEICQTEQTIDHGMWDWDGGKHREETRQFLRERFAIYAINQGILLVELPVETLTYRRFQRYVPSVGGRIRNPHDGTVEVMAHAEWDYLTLKLTARGKRMAPR